MPIDRKRVGSLTGQITASVSRCFTSTRLATFSKPNDGISPSDMDPSEGWVSETAASTSAVVSLASVRATRAEAWITAATTSAPENPAERLAS